MSKTSVPAVPENRYTAANHIASLKEQIRRQEEKNARREGRGDIPDMRAVCPTVVDLMVCHLATDGPSEGLTITLIGDDEGIKLYANAKPLERNAYFVAGTLQAALQALEAHLTNPDAKWHKAKSQRPPAKSKQNGSKPR